jgi:uncharacterized membrane protein YccF (DUF307 family)
MNSWLFFVLRFVWLVRIGLPIGLISIQIGNCLMLTIAGSPLGLWMFNQIPLIMTLRPDLKDRYKLGLQENEVFQGAGTQLPLILRLLYIFLAGRWLCFIWVNLASFVSVTIIGIPIGFYMFTCLLKVAFSLAIDLMSIA